MAEALGRLFNVHPVADDVYVNMQNAEAVTFVCVNTAGDTYTLTEAKTAAGGSAQVLATCTRFHVSATVGAAWALVTQAAGSTIVPTSAQDVAILHVAAVEMSDTFKYLKLASTGAGTVVAITHDLSSQRAPEKLAAIGV